MSGEGMSEYDDLVADLRAESLKWGPQWSTTRAILQRAADAIEAQAKEIDSLRVDNLGHVLGHTDALLRTRLDRLIAWREEAIQKVDEQRARAEKAEQEREDEIARAALLAARNTERTEP